MTAPTRTVGCVAAGLALLVLGGCGASPDEGPEVVATAGQQEPSASVTLLETRPQTVGEATVVAYNVLEDEAGVSVATGDGPAEAATVRVGDEVDVAGRTWQVVTISQGGGSDGAPGSKSGEVVLTPQD